LTNIPVVDLAPLGGGDLSARKAVARHFGHALESVGFVLIANHGVPAELEQRTYGQLQRFFSGPLADKTRLMPPERVKGRGYLPLGIERVAATLASPTPPDLCEALVFASIHREREGRGRPNFWPDNLEGFQPTIDAWFDAQRALCGSLMRLSALALDLPEDAFDAAYADPSLALRFVHYPDQPGVPEPGQLRYGAHHDYGGLTVLRQDGAPGGLQVFDRQGRWCDVPSVSGTYVINVGDLLQRWTNGRWKSTLHRVINPPPALEGPTQRLSMVAFTGPEESTEVACLPSCQGPDRPARYEPVLAGRYVLDKLRASMEPTADPAVAGTGSDAASDLAF
jgi:isopenicillin N synthase-like dioxygenase